MADLSLLLEFYENLVKSRRFDELLWDAYVNGKPLGMTHLGMGEEAVGTGSMKVFRDTDIVCPHHRAHPHLLMRGCDLKHAFGDFAESNRYLHGQGRRSTFYGRIQKLLCHWRYLGTMLYRAAGLCI